VNRTFKPVAYPTVSICPIYAEEEHLTVFLSYASEDYRRVRALYQRLKHEGWIEPWLDKEELLPGSDWWPAIQSAVKTRDAIVVCVSSAAVHKKGFIQREIRFALRVADEQPEGATYIVPVKFDDCRLPDRLSRWHYAELFKPGQYANLLKSLEGRAKLLTKKRH
jgi:hypothetical protein